MKYILILFTALIYHNLSAQSGKIEGKVTTSDNLPAEYVNISLKGSLKGTSTDSEGKFEIVKIYPGTYTVIASNIGLTKQEKQVTVKAGETSQLNFVLVESEIELSEIIVSEDKINPYYIDSAAIVSKLPLNDLDNPQVYNSISQELLGEQVVTNFNDALKNATGVSRLWESTGRGGDGAEFYAMRGFAVQPTMVNGMPSVNNGGLDPVNVESIQVIKGPSATLFGSPMISYGGLINITTKQPYEKFGGEFNLITGSNALNRLTADINVPLSEKVSARFNTAYHSENSFQDAGKIKSFFFAPSFLIKSNERLTFQINTEFSSSKSVDAPMIFLSRYSPITFDDIEPFALNYEKSFTGNELAISNPTYGLQAQALYKLSDSWTSQTVLSRSNTNTSGYYQYLWDLGDGDTFVRYISNRNGETNTTDIQQNFIGDFNLGNMRNLIIVGIDYFKSDILNSSTGWVGDGEVTLSNSEDTGDLTKAGVDNLLADSFEGNSTAVNEVLSSYMSDVITLTPTLSAMLSVRFDYFKGKTAYWAEDEVDGQSAVSPKFGLVYQPFKDKLSVFANYMNGFANVAPTQVSDVDGSNPRLKIFEPENANQMEVGIKTNLIDNRLSLTGSYYSILVRNRVMGDPDNINNSIQGGEVKSEGFEISLIANPINGLNIIAGFSDNQSEVTKDNPGDGYVGLRPEEAGPEQLLNFWASYTLRQGSLKGLGFGFGGNSASEYKTINRENVGTFVLPAYTALNASVSYSGSQYSIIFKVNNLTNQEYYSGWSTVTPQNLRNASLALSYRF